MILLSSSSPTLLAGSGWLAGADGLARQIDDRVEQIEAPNLSTVPAIPPAIRLSDDLHEEVVEILEPTEEDETEHSFLEVRRIDVSPFSSQTGLCELSVDRAQTPFLLLAFPSRGSPSA